MSGIAGILHLDNSPVRGKIIAQMVEATAYRGSDGQHTWHSGSVALGHCHFWTTPEDIGETQPIGTDNGRYHIVADARIDNRDELISTLKHDSYNLNKISTDAQIILAAYIRWGEQCAEHLIGDFAFTIWDDRDRTLFTARDVMGIRPFLYTKVDGVFYFASTVGAILAALPQRPALNEPLMIDYLRGSLELGVCQTVYAGLDRLPPAHSLTISHGKLQSPRLYYVFGQGTPPDCHSNTEWIAGFRSVLNEAIRCRLRSHTPVGMAVSGGLDSSAIACAAHEIGEKSNNIPAVRLYSTIFNNTPGADEKKYFDLVAAHCRDFDSVRIPSDNLWALSEFGTEGNYPLEEPELLLLRSHTLAMFRNPAADGCRVVLWGNGGDALTGLNVYEDPNLLFSLGWREMLAEYKYYTGKVRTILHNNVRPFLPAFVLRRRSHRNYLGTAINKLQQQPLINCPLEHDYLEPALNTPVAHHLHSLIRSPSFLVRSSLIDTLVAYSGVEQRLPYLDRRLIEFVLYLPLHLLSYRGGRRTVLYTSMEKTLPEPVRNRWDKADFSGLIRRGLKQEKIKVEDLLSGSRLAARGWINEKVLRQEIADYCRKGSGIPPFGNALCLEAWLRQLE